MKENKKNITGFKEFPEMKDEIKKEINEWIKQNGWHKILPDKDFAIYEPISNYKNELGLTGKKANEYLEKMGYIIRKESYSDKNGKTKNLIILTEKGKRFGRQMINLVIVKKDIAYILKVEKYVIWSPEIVNEIKKFIKKGEENSGYTKSKNNKI